MTGGGGGEKEDGGGHVLGSGELAERGLADHRLSELARATDDVIVCIDPRIELVEQRQRVLRPQGKPLLDAQSLGLLLDLVDLADELQRNGSPFVSHLPGSVEAAAHVHHAAEPPLERNQNLHLAVDLDEARVAAVVVDLDRRVLGTDSWRRSQILLSRDAANHLTVGMGALHGLSVGTILAVKPTSDQADADRLLGHVRVDRVRSQSADVTPVAYNDAPAPAPTDFPERARCEIVFEDFGDFKLPLAIDVPLDSDSEADDGWLARFTTVTPLRSAALRDMQACSGRPRRSARSRA